MTVLRPQPKTKTEAISQSCQASPCQPQGTGFGRTSLRLPASTLALGLPGPSLLALPPPTATCVYNPEAPGPGLRRLVPASAQPHYWGNQLPLVEIQEASALPASGSGSAGTEWRPAAALPRGLLSHFPGDALRRDGTAREHSRVGQPFWLQFGGSFYKASSFLPPLTPPPSGAANPFS